MSDSWEANFYEMSRRADELQGYVLQLKEVITANQQSYTESSGRLIEKLDRCHAAGKRIGELVEVRQTELIEDAVKRVCETCDKAIAERDALREELRRVEHKLAATQDESEGLRAEVARLNIVIKHKNATIDRYLPCPDCRDKVKAGECERCKRQSVESENARLRDQLSERRMGR